MHASQLGRVTEFSGYKPLQNLGGQMMAMKYIND